MPAASDAAVLDMAVRDGRVLLTQDKDFGELVFRSPIQGTFGVVLFRLTGSGPRADNERIVNVICERTDWIGQFAVVSESQIRMWPLPISTE